MAPEAVVCIACGYDTRQGRQLRTEVTADPQWPPEYGPSSVKTRWAIILAVCAAVAAAVVFLLVWRPFWLPALGPRHEESEEEKYREAAAAFGGKQAPVDAGTLAEIREVFHRFQAAQMTADAGKIEHLCDADRIYQEHRRLGAFADVSPLQERKEVARLHKSFAKSMAQFAQFFAGGRYEVKWCRFLQDPSEAMAYTRFCDEEGDSVKIRWWLKKRDGSWRIYDLEELSTGMRLSDTSALLFISTSASPQRRAEFKRWFLQFQTLSSAVLAEDLAAAERALANLDSDSPLLPQRLRAVCWLLRATVYNASDRYTEALLFCARAAAVDADMPLLHLCRAVAYNGLDRYDEANRSAERYLEQLGDDAEGYLQLGVALTGLKRNDEAAAAFRQGLDDDPNSVPNLIGLVDVLPPGKEAEIGRRFARMTRRTERFQEMCDTFLEEENAPALETVLAVCGTTLGNEPQVHYYAAELHYLRRDCEALVQTLTDHRQSLLADEADRDWFEDRMIRGLIGLRRFDAAREQAEQSRKRSGDPWYPTLVHAASGNVQETAAGLQHCVERGDSPALFYADEILGPLLQTGPFAEVRTRFPDPDEQDPEVRKSAASALRKIEPKAAEKAAARVDETKFITPEELDKIPVGIKVVHEPKVSLATLTGKSERRSKYTWWYKTTVSAATEVTIVEFGGFAWQEGKWVVAGSFTGKPYAAEEFAEWYRCPNAILKPGTLYSDPTNWSTAPELKAGKTRWYFIGVDGQGRRVKGEAIIELKAAIDPNKPEDPGHEGLVAFEIKEVGGAMVVTFTGDNVTLEGARFRTVHDRLLRLAEQNGRKDFLLDLSNVRFVGEDALGMLIGLNKRIARAEGRLRLCSLQPEIQKVFVLLGFDRLFNIHRDVDEALKAVERIQKEELMVAEMSAGELSKRWRKESLEYVAATNEHVRRGMQTGWDQAGQPPQEKRQLLARRVIDAVREANKTGELADLRERFPPAHSPFIDMLEENGQPLAPMAILDDGRIVLGIGYENGHVVVIDGTKVEKVAGVLAFGRSPNRKYFAVARDKSIDIHEGWDGAKVASLNWPKLGPLEGVQPVEQLIPFPDGQRVVLATPDAIMAVESRRAQLLYPRDVKGLQESVEQVNLNNPHAAISPNGSLISISDRLVCQHLVFNDRYEVVGEISPLVDVSPCHTSFSGDGKLLTLSSFRLYNGATLGVPTSRFPGLSISNEVLHKRLVSESATGEKRIPGLGLIGRDDWFLEDTIVEIHKRVKELDQGLVLLDYNSRVYAAAWRGEEFIIGDAYGYLRAFDKAGKFLWQHFIGSSVSSIDVAPDGKTLVVTTYAGFVCILDLDTGKTDPFTIGTATHRERRRWLFWTKEPTPLVW